MITADRGTAYAQHISPNGAVCDVHFKDVPYLLARILQPPLNSGLPNKTTDYSHQGKLLFDTVKVRGVAACIDNKSMVSVAAGH